MTRRDTRLQAAVLRQGDVLVLHMQIDDGRRFWLLPGGGREDDDQDDAAAIVREVREETGLAVTVDRHLLDNPAIDGDTRYRRYRTFLCHPTTGEAPVAGARDGVAQVRETRWLRLDDERDWGSSIVGDRFLYPQLLALRAAIAGTLTLDEPDGSM